MKQAKHATKTNNNLYLCIGLALLLVALLIVFSKPFDYSAYAEEVGRSNQTEWQQSGYESSEEYYKALQEKAESSQNLYSDFIGEYGDIATDDQKIEAAKLAALMCAPASIHLYEQDKKAFDELIAECKKAKQTAYPVRSYSAYSGGSSYSHPSGNGVLTRSNGSIYYNGHRETWYSTNEAGQTVTAYHIPGKNVGSDGVIRDKDGYICVASKHHGAGTVIETSRGTGKVYDKCGTNAIDIYTNW